MVNMPLEDVEVHYNKAVLELEQMVRLLRTGRRRQSPPAASPAR